jgi:hypothetical protein
MSSDEARMISPERRQLGGDGICGLQGQFGKAIPDKITRMKP